MSGVRKFCGLICAKVVGSSGKVHRKCTVHVPRVFADAYPDHQQFQIEQTKDKVLIFRPVEYTLEDSQSFD